ncbi:MAG TPA: phosphoribosyltransferase family protein [Candidatus Saccharibacteria bacterium]|nr:phosphoribosyltransferase family protein [Candidatus Saccharibacteria bacterium]
MYFESREDAGRKLAEQLLQKYRYDNCAVIALSDGAAVDGEQIAIALHSILTMIFIEDIAIPGENLSFGGVSQDGGFTYNADISEGHMQGFVSEFNGYLQEQKRAAFQKINRLIGDGGLVDKALLQDHTIILVSDGLDSGTPIDVALDFLKPVRINKLVIAAPVATVPIVDKLHVVADELHILDVKQNYFGANHYYENNTIPDHGQIIERINKIVLNWR